MSTRPSPTARVFVAGSADGVGRAAAQTLPRFTGTRLVGPGQAEAQALA